MALKINRNFGFTLGYYGEGMRYLLSQLRSILSKPDTRIDEEHLKLVVRRQFNSRRYIFGVCLFSLEPTSRIYSSQSNLHKRITPFTTWWKTWKTRFYRLKNKTREREMWLHPNLLVHSLKKVNWSDKNKILRTDQNSMDRRNLFEFQHDLTRSIELRTNFLLNRMTTPWNNIP